MTCDKCRTGELQTVRVRRYSPSLAVVGYVLSILALAAALAAGAHQYKSASAAPTDDAPKQDAITKLRQIDAVTPAMIVDFQADGQISETSLSTLNPDDRSDVDQILSDYHRASLDATGGGTNTSGLFLYVVVYVLCGALFIIGVALTLKKEMLQCAACGAVSEV